MHVTLGPELLYEVAFVNDAAKGDALQLYLGSLATEARDAGAESVAELHVTHIEHSDVECQAVAIIAWKTEAQYQAFHGRATWPREVLESRLSVPVRVAEASSVSLVADGRYEFAAFWMNRENAGLNDTYFQVMAPMVHAAGPRAVAQLNVAPSAGPLAVSPHRFNLLEWTGAPEARAAMFASEAFKQAGYMRALAVDRLLTVMVSPGD